MSESIWTQYEKVALKAVCAKNKKKHASPHFPKFVVVMTLLEIADL